MSQITAWIELALGWAGSLVGVLFYSAILLGLLGWQYLEYRQWRLAHAPVGWWLIKLATPAAAFLVVMLALAVFNTEGLEGLAVFYLALFASLAIAPLAISVLARTLGIPRQDGLRVAGTMVITVVAGWFLGASVMHSAGGLDTSNFDGRADYIAFKHAAERVDDNAGIIEQTSVNVRRLPDGMRYLNLGFAVPQGYRVYSVDVRTEKKGKLSNWSSTLGTCTLPGEFHLTNVVDRSERFDVRLRFHAGNPESMVGITVSQALPLGDTDSLPWLGLTLRDRTLVAPVPVPANWTSLITSSGDRLKASILVPPAEEGERAMAPGNDCLLGEIALTLPVERLELELYSEEHYRKQRYLLP